MKTEDILYKLSRSKFRSSFNLKEKDKKYIEKKSLEKIKEHAYDFVNQRLKDIRVVKDGKQTPTHGHPVFIAQHATATCCRTCLEKWHHIDKNKIFSCTIYKEAWDEVEKTGPNGIRGNIKTAFTNKELSDITGLESSNVSNINFVL